MNFAYNENQVMIADMIRKFGEEHIRPKMMEWDEAETFPIEVFKKLGTRPSPRKTESGSQTGLPLPSRGPRASLEWRVWTFYKLSSWETNLTSAG